MRFLQGQTREKIINHFRVAGMIVVLVVGERLVRYLSRDYPSFINSRVIYGQINLSYPIIIAAGLLVLMILTGYGRIKLGSYTLVVILVGVILNLFDWYRLGGVLDYLSVWRVIFNLADVYVIVGLTLAVWNTTKMSGPSR